MAGETHLLDVPFDNVAGDNFQPYQVVDIDAANSTIHVTAVTYPSSSSPDAIGVVYDMAKLDQNGDPVTNSGVAVRVEGIARVVATGAINAGSYVTPSTSKVAAVTTASTWQNKPVLGRALTTADSSGDQILVLLTPGNRF